MVKIEFINKTDVKITIDEETANKGEALFLDVITEFSKQKRIIPVGEPFPHDETYGILLCDKETSNACQLIVGNVRAVLEEYREAIITFHECSFTERKWIFRYLETLVCNLFKDI